jgi:hypothetical protein
MALWMLENNAALSGIDCELNYMGFRVIVIDIDQFLSAVLRIKTKITNLRIG